LPDWLALFGFRLDDIPRLQAILPRPRTSLLDSTVYDDGAEIPWFRERRQDSALPPVVPLSQILATAGPMPLSSLVATNRDGFRYAKIGQYDAFAFPDLVPGSIVRANPASVKHLLPQPNGEISKHIFLVEHGRGLCCCRLHLAAENRITLAAAKLPFAQVELRLRTEVRILGVLDLEFRPANPRHPEVPPDFAKLWTPAPLTDWHGSERPRVLLRNARLRAGLSLREASEMSRQIANALRDTRYFASPGSLSDYEANDTPPRHIHKLLTICILYCLSFFELVRAFGLRLNETGRDPIPDTWMERRGGEEEPQRNIPAAEGGFFPTFLARFSEIPFFLRDSLSSLSGLAEVSLRDVFWVGGQRQLLHPSLAGALFVIVNHRKKKPAAFRHKPVWEQPLYLLQRRDGSHLLASCSLEDHTLVVHPYSEGFRRPEHFRDRVDAEVVGQIVAAVRSLTPSE
jgi:hypothetical protein